MSNTETVALHRPNYFLEFVVVFLGVTISFWLSQWNEERKTAALHKEDVVSLLEDLDRDRIRLEYVSNQPRGAKADPGARLLSLRRIGGARWDMEPSLTASSI